MTLQQLYLARARERAQLAPVPRVERFGRWLDRIPYAAAWFWCFVVPAMVAITAWWLW